MENLCGIELPKGKGIMTRVPLVLAMRSIEEGEEHYCTFEIQNKDEVTEVAEFNERMKGKQVSFEEVTGFIKEATDLAAGPEKNVKDTSIYVNVYQHSRNDLTLVDLPGLTRKAIKVPRQAHLQNLSRTCTLTT